MLEFLHSYQSGPDTIHDGQLSRFDCSKSSGFFVENQCRICHLLSVAFFDIGESAGNYAARWPLLDHLRALFLNRRASSFLFDIKRVMTTLLNDVVWNIYQRR